LATPADSGQPRPHYPASPAAKPRKVKDYSDGASKAELRRTAWWSWQDSNPQANGYERWTTRCVERVASVGETEQLMLTRPSDWRIEQAGNADATGEPTVDGCLDQVWCEEGFISTTTISVFSWQNAMRDWFKSLGCTMRLSIG
jgi:hypothetical protein